MKKSLFRVLWAVILVVLLAPVAKGGEIIEGDGTDGYIDQAAVNDGAYDHFYNLYVGCLYGTTVANMVEGFPLPYLAPGQQVTAASISFFLEQKNTSPNYNVQLYGLNRVSTTTGVPVAGDYYVGTNDTANTLLNATFVTPSSAVNAASTYSGSNLASFIQKQYANAAFSGLDLNTSTRFVFFRLSPDAGTQGAFNNYQFANTRNPNRAFHPTLSLTISNGLTNVAGRLQFSFNLPKASITSAGVYNATTGALIRTLWNNVQYTAGNSYGVWDGNDDNGVAVPTGTNYRVKLIFHNVQYIWQGMVGNTSTTQTGPSIYRSFNNMQDMCIAGNTAYYTMGYNEQQNPLGSFTVGSPQSPRYLSFGYDFSDVASAITYVASDATRSYWSKGFGGYYGSNTYIIAVTNGTTSSFYTFPKGTTPTGTNQRFSSCIDFDATANQPNPATGLAVQKTGNALFVSHGSLNLIRVFDKVQGNLLGTIPVTNPGRLAMTANGDIWVMSNAPTPVILRYTFANGAGTLKQTISGLVAPAGLGVSADDSLLLVADGGSSQQVKAFNNSTGAPVWTYGLLGGMAVTGPTITSNSFLFNNQRANSTEFDNAAFFAFQADNTFWVSDEGNGRVMHFSISGNTLTYIEQIAYSETSYQSTVDVTDATRVFNTFMEYSVNYGVPLGGTNGSWKMVKNWVVGLPSDSTHRYFGYANGFTNVATLSNGHTYGFLGNMATGQSDLFELPANGPARPTGYTYSNVPRMYPDGTLRFNVTGTASISFYSQPLTGFDAKNNPVWGSPALLATTAMGATDPKTWSAYPERTEVTASGMVVNYDGNAGDTGYHLGGIPVGGTAWQWRSAHTVPSCVWFPQDGHFDVGDGVVYAGDYHMALGRNVICGYHGEFWRGGQASQWINFLDNGLMVGRFGTYEGSSPAGAVDGYAGNAFAPTLVHGPDGNTYLYHNDESNHGGTIRWLISGWDGITELNGTGTVGGTASLSPSVTGPMVSVTSPTTGATYLNGHTVFLSAEAGGTGAGITSVQFFDGSTSLGTVTSAPYSLNYPGLSAGTHVITAKAMDANNASATSASVTITVGTDGSSAPPPAPISLSTGAVAAQSVVLNWTQPTASSTSSTIGQILSFQCIVPGDANTLPSTTVAGAPPYAAAHFNPLGEVSVTTNEVNFPNSMGATVTNVGLGYQVAGSGGSSQTLSGTTKMLFAGEVTTQYNTQTAITMSNIPYAMYDVVVYSLPSGTGTQIASVTVSDNMTTSVVKQTITALTTNYSVASVPFGTSSTVTNANTIVIQGLTSSSFELQGGNIAAFQIVQRPYDQGTPTSYSIERALGTGGTFAAVGSTTGGALTYTDTNGLSGATTYQYRVKATNSFGSSAYSNTVSVTTTAGGTSVVSPPAPGFATWQAQYFTGAQTADPNIGGPNADPYGSGVPNLMAYALGLNPASARTSDIPTPAISNGHLVMTYVVPSSITDINYIPEVSADLRTWGTGTGYTQVITNVSSSSGHTITVQDTLPTTTQKHFMRLRVTQH